MKKKNLFQSRVSTKFDEHRSFKSMCPTHFWQATACNMAVNIEGVLGSGEQRRTSSTFRQIRLSTLCP